MLAPSRYDDFFVGMYPLKMFWIGFSLELCSSRTYNHKPCKCGFNCGLPFKRKHSFHPDCHHAQYASYLIIIPLYCPRHFRVAHFNLPYVYYLRVLKWGPCFKQNNLKSLRAKYEKGNKISQKTKRYILNIFRQTSFSMPMVVR